MSPRLNLDPRLLPAELLDELEKDAGRQGMHASAADSRMRAYRDKSRTKSAKAKTQARKRERARKNALNLA